jgi:hypothetical protein
MRLLLLFEDTYEGLVKAYDPSTKLLGAENREGVTCYLDALLFAMFARLDSFEAMLYNSFDDLPRKKLAGLLRLWVNMLRSGRLITRDIVRSACLKTPTPQPLTLYLDQTLTGFARRMRMGLSSRAVSARHFRGFHLHHWPAGAPATHSKDGPVPHGQGRSR